MSMTQQEVAQWLKDKGVHENVIKDESSYIADKYADPGEDPRKVLEASLGSYLQRSASGGNRDEGGYDTNYDDPARGNAAARTDSPWGAPGSDAAPPPQPPINSGSGQPSNTATASSAMTSWTGAPAAEPSPDYSAHFQQQNDLLRQMFERQVAEQNRVAGEQAARDAELKARRDALFGQLQGRAQQSLSIDPTQDPIIKGQVDNYRAEQERALRNVRSDAAEAGNALRPTQDRMATERVAQGVASMQSELMARELSARRAEIADALAGEGNMLGADQQVGLQQQLASLDNIIRQQQLGISGRGLDLERELGLGQLGLGYGRLGLDTELGRGDLSLRDKLGMGGLSNDLMRTLLQNQQFYGDLDQRRVFNDREYDLYNRGRMGNRI